MKNLQRPDLKFYILDCFEDGKPHQIDEIISCLLKFAGLTSDHSKTLSEEQLKKFTCDVDQDITKLFRMSLLQPNKKPNTYERTKTQLSDVLGPFIDEHLTQSEISQRVEKFWNGVKSYYLQFQSADKRPIESKFGLVSLIDLLGTKGSRKLEEQSEMLEKWHMFIPKFKTMLKLGCPSAEIMPSFHAFSDTIIITIEGKKENIEGLLRSFAFAASAMMYDSIKYRLPIRGCFSVGNFLKKGSFVIGEAVDEVAQYYELPQWIGISAAPSARRIIEKMKRTKIPIVSSYRKCTIPLKQSVEQDAWAVDWIDDALSETYEKGEPDILEMIDDGLKEIKNVNHALKWKNTKIFLLSDSDYPNDEIDRV